MANMQRRTFVKGAMASLVVLTTPFSLAKSDKKAPKVVWVVLRGAMDGMHAVIPVFDPMLSQHRPQIASKVIDSPLLLDQGYRLHPEFKQLHTWYQNKQASFVVAVGSGYPSRSHFDGQDYLESAGQGQESGWLARALEAKQGAAVAITQATPLVCGVRAVRLPLGIRLSFEIIQRTPMRRSFPCIKKTLCYNKPLLKDSSSR